MRCSLASAGGRRYGSPHARPLHSRHPPAGHRREATPPRGGVRAVAAESLLLKHQLLIRKIAPVIALPISLNLDRFVLGLATLFVSPRRIPKLGALVKPATLFQFHKALVNRKYRLLFSSRDRRCKPGPKGPSAELIAAIVESKCRNPSSGCVRIFQKITMARVGRSRAVMENACS